MSNKEYDDKNYGKDCEKDCEKNGRNDYEKNGGKDKKNGPGEPRPTKDNPTGGGGGKAPAQRR